MSTKVMPVAYLCYPFDKEQYFNADLYSEAVMVMYKLGYNPVVCEPHLIGSWGKQQRLNMACTLIELCEVFCVFYEEEMTSMMIRELLYAKERGKRIITVEIGVK